MGYQALLFCPDEKNARVVTQVLSELDFSVDTAHEPFAAVKKLMAQHFDALVVDCENEQNASLLFRSARNSNANQSSLAVAVVEGQAGVAKAFRIGANLVLTKPINVEQSKGTLRVARGLLRKASEPGKPPAAQSFTPSAEQPASTNSFAAKPGMAPRSSVSRPPAGPLPGWEKAPALEQPSRPSASLQSSPPATGLSALEAREASQSQATPTTAKNAISPTLLHDAEAGKATPVQERPAAVPANPPFISTTSRATGTAAATAPAKELPSSLLAAMEATSSLPTAGAEPSFSSLDIEGESSSKLKKIVIALLAVLVIATAAYFGYKHGNKDEQPAPSAPEPQITESRATAPATSNAVAPVTTKSIPEPPAVNATRPTAPAPKPSPTMKSSSPETIAEDTTVSLEKVEPLKVKSDIARPAPAKSAAQPTDQAAPPAPGVLNISGSNPDDKALSNLVASAPVSVPKPAPQVLNISQGVTQGMVTRRVQPTYPQQALSMRIHGEVQLLATISKEGNITNVKVLSGEGLLARAAVDAVRQWKYKPYFLNGEPVEIQTEITVNFKLPN